MTKHSTLAGFYKKTVAERQDIIKEWADLTNEEVKTLTGENALTPEHANNMIENVIGIHSLPFAIATNFLINEKNVLIPVVVEEPSVVAALGNAAKLFREGGGFHTHSDDPIMIGQVQLLDIESLEAAQANIFQHTDEIIQRANEVAGSILKRGGGTIGIETRLFPNTSVGNMLVVHLLYDTRDAMGANAVNTAAEHIAPFLEDITGGRANLRILSNLTDRRKAYAEGIVPASQLARDGITGEEAVQRIVEAGVLAEVDPYRATTHNKGIMNGIDAIVVATGNDWRAIEAGAHAYAARDGQYRSLTKWEKTSNGDLKGSIEIPMAVGTVGGATKVHPTAQIAMKILGYPDSKTLAEIIACVGLAQNFGAIRALAMEGIQNGHMRMHAKQLAVAAGASPEQVGEVTRQLIASNVIRLEKAKEIVIELNKGQQQ
jgi:hydroxymethylglutaryl-CoA reductase